MIQALFTTINKRKARVALLALSGASFFAVLGWSAAVAFQRHAQPVPLAATNPANTPRLGDRPAPAIQIHTPVRHYEEVGSTKLNQPTAPTPQPINASTQTHQPSPTGVKLNHAGNIIMVNGQPWTGETFDGKPIRPIKTQTMKTTAYSPDEKSCGKWADGITASGKSVWMNGGRLVAADKSVPFGTILTIPGYNDNKPVQVWDRGGAIKGNRLDLLYPTHEIALKWGVQDLPVVFWQFVATD